MKIKWTIITLLSLTAIAAASYWGVDVFNDNKTYQRNMQSAREAVAAHEWSDAAVYYKAARKVHVSIENRTALEQLNYLERADKEIQADNWPSALLSLIHISEPTRRTPISYAVFCLKKKNSLPLIHT